MKQVYTIYRATNKVNGKVYVGYTSLTLNQRRKQHEDQALKDNDRYFYNAMRKHGKNAFVWVVLYQSLDGEHALYEMEPHFILVNHSHYSENGYNLSWGGEESTNGMKKYTDGQISRLYHVGLQPDGWTLYKWDASTYNKLRRAVMGNELNAREREKYHADIDARREQNKVRAALRRATQTEEEWQREREKAKERYYDDVEKSRQYALDYLNENRDQINERARQLYHQNIEEKRQKRKERYQANIEENRAKNRANYHKYKAKKNPA